MPRRENDFYSTPKSLTLALLANLPELYGRVYEPCAGPGEMSRALVDPKRIPQIVTADIDPSMPVQCVLDARNQWPDLLIGKQDIRFDWVVSNPPFFCAREIIDNCLRHCTNVAMLLPLGFMEPAAVRADWLKTHLPSKVIYVPRTSFTGDGKTNSLGVMWVIWSEIKLSGPPIAVVSKGDLERYSVKTV